MGITEELFVILQVLLPIILSRSLLQGLSPAGVRGRYLFVLNCSANTKFYNRCTALPTDIDGLRGRRTRAFTDVLLETLDSKTLWDEYGIDDDILVCRCSTPYSLSNS